MNFELTILGSNSAVPAFGRHPTAQILHHFNERFLIDCGEGTQFRMSHFGIKRSQLNTIFISHLHGDHYFGLVGLVNSLRMSGRKDPMTIYGPPKLKEILDIQIDLVNHNWGFDINFIELNHGSSQLIHENSHLEVYTIPLDHKGMICNGFLFKEKIGERKIRAEKLDLLKRDYDALKRIKKGADYIDEEGNLHSNESLTLDPDKPKSYAYCSDTKYTEAIVPIIEQVSLLYHESTFMDEHKDKAEQRYHSTASQAAMIAKLAKADKLLLGHFSARYARLDGLLSEAKEVFPNSFLGLEGLSISV